jgi:putative endopeptidase
LIEIPSELSALRLASCDQFSGIGKHMISLRFLLAASATVALAAPALAQTKPVYGSWGYQPSAMDRSVKPGDDFWAFVNGSWDKSTQIASDRTSAGPFVKLADAAERDVHAIVDNYARAPSGDLSGQQIGSFYASYMDDAKINTLGAAPLKPYLAQIEAAKTRAQLLSLFWKTGYASPIGIGITPDPKNPTHYVASSGQARLGLPSRDYYLSSDPKMVGIRAAYSDYIQNIQRLAGLPGGAESAGRIIALETALAQAQWTPAQRRDIDKTYNPMNRAQLAALAPEFDWNTSLTQRGLASATTVIVGEPSAVTAAGKLLASAPLSTWKEWLAFRFASDHATVLSKPFDDARFEFYSKKLSGQPAQRERWKRGVAITHAALGEAIGKIYVKDHFPAESERQMTELIGNLRAAYAERISANSWMDDATRREALAKLAAFDPRIGHPVKYIDYSPFKVVRGDAFGNAIRAEDFQWKLQLKRLPKPVDRSLWAMTPQTINAYYNPLVNQITFPAAILQAPFFDPAADPAVNYGAIGAVIGHEMGHGFDDQGRKFDAKGQLRDWWSPNAVKNYSARTATLVKEYDAFSPYTGVNVNGQLTLGENLGDLSGVEAAYVAYKKYVAQHGQPPVIDGLTGDQRFFIGYAQAWQAKTREDAERQQILTDPHSPGKYRVNGVVPNIDAWYTAFNVKPGDAMYLPPEQRVHIW